MKRENKVKLNDIINEFSVFLEKEFSSKFKNLSDKEDKQLFFLAKILTQLKQVYKEETFQELKKEKVLNLF